MKCWAALGVLVVLLTGGCMPAPHSDAALSARIAKEVAKGPGTVFTLDSVTDFEWERAYIFGPYTPIADVDRDLGFAWSGASMTGIESSDSINLLVFVKQRSVVRYVEFPRSLGDFAGPGGTGPWTPNARFEVSEGAPGESPLLVAPTDPAAAP